MDGHIVYHVLVQGLTSNELSGLGGVRVPLKVIGQLLWTN